MKMILKKISSFFAKKVYNYDVNQCGAVAQLGERCVRNA